MSKCVTHLIIGLGVGGAETMLYQLLLHKSDPELTYRVISLGEGRYYEDPIRELGVELTVLPFRKKPFSSFSKLKKSREKHFCEIRQNTYFRLQLKICKPNISEIYTG